MYGLPKNFDASIFVQRTLEQICFNANQVVFSFDGQITVTVEGSFAHMSDRGEQTYDVPVSSASIMGLVGLVVKSASATADGTLSLAFHDGQALKFLDDVANYESYQIKHGDVITIV